MCKFYREIIGNTILFFSANRYFYIFQDCHKTVTGTQAKRLFNTPTKKT